MLRSRFEKPAVWTGLAWALLLQLVFWRLFVPSSLFDFTLRGLALSVGLSWWWRRVGRTWNFPWVISLLGLFLVPMTAAVLPQYFLYYLARAACVAGVCLWIGVHHRDHKGPLKVDLANLLYIGALISWGWWLCSEISDTHMEVDGWLWRLTETDLRRLIKDDGEQYIFLGTHLNELFTTMYRVPGYPLLIRGVFSLLGPNIHYLVVSNVLCLLATVHLIIQFASSFLRVSWWRLILLVPFIFYFQKNRLPFYTYVLTDPLCDLLMVIHLVLLYRYLINEKIRDLKWMVGLQCLTLFIRPTLLYYNFALWGALIIRAWWRKQPSRSLHREFALWIGLPVVAVLCLHRLVHGTFAFSAMPGHVLSYYTYGTMVALEKNVATLRDVQLSVQADIDQNHQAKNIDQLGLSKDGIKAVVDKAFAVEKILENPRLAWAAITVGIERLLWPHGGLDFLILLLALAMAVWRDPWWLLVLWPLYLIPLYSLEGFGMEYRFTLQIVLPMAMILLAQLTRVLAVNSLIAKRLAGWSLPTWRLGFSAPPFVFVLALGLIVALSLTPLFLKDLSAEDDFHQDILTGQVIASRWDRSARELHYRLRLSPGLLVSRTMKANQGLSRETEELLFAHQLVPANYVHSFNSDPRLAEREDFLSRGVRSGRAATFLTTGIEPDDWSLKLNQMTLAQVRWSKVVPQNGIGQQTLEVDLAPWLKWLLPMEFQAQILWRPGSCEVLTEQIRLTDSKSSTVYTTFYDRSENLRFQFTDRFDPVRGMKEFLETLPLTESGVSPFGLLCSLFHKSQNFASMTMLTNRKMWTVERVFSSTPELTLQLKEKPDIRWQMLFADEPSSPPDTQSPGLPKRLEKMTFQKWPFTVQLGPD